MTGTKKEEKARSNVLGGLQVSRGRKLSAPVSVLVRITLCRVGYPINTLFIINPAASVLNMFDSRAVSLIRARFISYER